MPARGNGMDRRAAGPPPPNASAHSRRRRTRAACAHRRGPRARSAPAPCSPGTRPATAATHPSRSARASTNPAPAHPAATRSPVRSAVCPSRASPTISIPGSAVEQRLDAGEHHGMIVCQENAHRPALTTARGRTACVPRARRRSRSPARPTTSDSRSRMPSRPRRLPGLASGCRRS